MGAMRFFDKPSNPCYIVFFSLLFRIQANNKYNLMNKKKSSAKLNPRTKTLVTVVGIFVLSLIFTSTSFAQDVQEQIKCNAIGEFDNTSLEYAVNNLWVLVAAILVLMMQLGFAMLEAGFNPAKNTVNVLFKNVSDACLGILVYFAFGYALMYRPETSCELANVVGIPGFFGISLPYLFLNGLFPREGAEHLSIYIDFFFQAAFAATAATICSGAVAGRIKPWAYLLLAFLITGLVYPVSGYWVWGGGWLVNLGFHDFAGSLVVHTVGGAAALAVVMILGARKGRFHNLEEAEESDFASHSLPLAAMGTFLLWIGWYGFNAGSTMGITGQVSSPEVVGKIALNTTIAACSSVVIVIGYEWVMYNRIRLSSVLNSVLGGLVGITASCDVIKPYQSLIVGIVAGMIVISGVNWLFKKEIDDAVGAIPVHCFCGIWGGIAAGLFIEKINLGTQFLGSLVIFLWSFIVVWFFFKLLSKRFTIGVKQNEEINGLDWLEHGEYAYVSLEKKNSSNE